MSINSSEKRVAGLFMESLPLLHVLRQIKARDRAKKESLRFTPYMTDFMIGFLAMSTLMTVAIIFLFDVDMTQAIIGFFLVWVAAQFSAISLLLLRRHRWLAVANADIAAAVDRVNQIGEHPFNGSDIVRAAEENMGSINDALAEIAGSEPASRAVALASDGGRELSAEEYAARDQADPRLLLVNSILKEEKMMDDENFCSDNAFFAWLVPGVLIMFGLFLYSGVVGDYRVPTSFSGAAQFGMSFMGAMMFLTMIAGLMARRAGINIQRGQAKDLKAKLDGDTEVWLQAAH